MNTGVSNERIDAAHAPAESLSVIWACAQADLRRYGGWHMLLREQSLWPVLWFRLGCALNLLRPAPLRRLVLAPWWLLFRFLELLTGVSLPLGARIAGGLRIWHFGGVFVHPNASIGHNCTLRQGVTIGNRHSNTDAPLIGDDVEFGAYAQVLGGIRIGSGAKIGAMSVVLKDVPAGCTAVGSPARIIEPHRSNAA
jgi:serine O-acetyltransferase